MKYLTLLCLLVWGYGVHATELTIQTRENGPVTFEVELAVTPEQTQEGLMYRLYLPPNKGMLFIEPEDRVWSMWMKNTFIPLDMLFIDRNGMIVKVAKNAKPHDLTPINSPQKVAGVLEIGGGVAADQGIAVGDKVILPEIPNIDSSIDKI